MATITTRAGKGSPLTNTEVDDNFTNLNTDKAELSGATFTGNVGIGTSPVNKLHVLNTGTTAISNAIANSGAILDGGTGNIGLNMITPNTGACYINFGDSADSNAGRLIYNHNNNAMSFDTNAQERMRIDSSGNVLVGTTTTDIADATTETGIVLNNGGWYEGSRDGGTVGYFNRLSSDGEILSFRKDGSNIGSIGVVSSDNLYIQGNSTHHGLAFGSDAVVPFKNNAYTDNVCDIGSSSNRFKDLRLSGSGYFGGNVGIGTTSPTSTLHVKAATADLNIQSDDGQSASLTFGDVTDTSRGGIEYSSTDDLIFKTNNLQTRMTIRYTGNVGIGTTSPDTLLHVHGAGSGSGTYGAQITIGKSNGCKISSTQESADDDVQGLAFFTKSSNQLSDSAVERLRIDESGNVGIGTTSPDYPLEVNRVGTSGFGSVGLVPDTDNGHYIRYGGSGTNNDVFRLLGVGDSERMRIDTSGNLLVGTTTTNSTASSSGGTTTGVELQPSGELQIGSDDDKCAIFNRQSSDGEILRFRKDASTVGSIGTKDGDIYLGTGDTGLRFYDDGDSVYPAQVSDGAGRDAAVDLGSTSKRFKNIYRSGSTYSTSDRNKKQDIRDLTDAEARVATVAKGSLKAFRYIDSVEAEGDEANIHFGIIAQDLKAAFEAEGLNANDYQVFKTSTYTDDDGVEQTTYSVCYENLLAFIIAAI